MTEVFETEKYFYAPCRPGTAVIRKFVGGHEFVAIFYGDDADKRAAEYKMVRQSESTAKASKKGRKP
jgi:hypothetical protein